MAKRSRPWLYRFTTIAWTPDMAMKLRIPFTTGVLLPYNAAFTAAEFARLQAGLLPHSMDDKWLICYEEPHLSIHRSWTGKPVYRVALAERLQDWGVTEALWAHEFARGQEGETEYQAELVDFLISNLLLGQRKPFPIRDEDAEWPAGTVQHNFSGTAYPERVYSSKKI
jgi:hypothetical protein